MNEETHTNLSRQSVSVSLVEAKQSSKNRALTILMSDFLQPTMGIIYRTLRLVFSGAKSFFKRFQHQQILTTNCWITTIWRDTHLTWNSTDFGNISTIRLPFDTIWRPDIILYNK